MMRVAWNVLVYAAFVAGAAWLVLVAIDLDVAGYLALPAIQTIAALAVLALERALPFRHDWLRSHGDLRTDILHLVVSTNLALGLRWLLIAGAVALAGSTGLGGDAWPSQWPLAAQVAVVLAIQTFVGYWIHRTAHAFRPLWRFHAIHHSAPRVYWLNQWRVHPIEGLLDGLSMVPVVVLGAPEVALLVYTSMNAVHLVLQHANIDLRLGWLGGVVSMSEAHRWHHSQIRSEADGNYGGFVLIWDRVFGTYVDPPGRDAPESAGLDHAFPTGYFAQLAAPFRRGGS